MIPATKTLACSPRGICTLAILATTGYISAIAVVVLLGFGPMHRVALRVVHPLASQWSVHHSPSGTSSTRQCSLVQPGVGRAYHVGLGDLDVLPFSMS